MLRFWGHNFLLFLVRAIVCYDIHSTAQRCKSDKAYGGTNRQIEKAWNAESFEPSNGASAQQKASLILTRLLFLNLHVPK